MPVLPSEVDRSTHSPANSRVNCCGVPLKNVIGAIVSRVSLARPNLRMGVDVPAWGTRNVWDRDCDTLRSGVVAEADSVGLLGVPTRPRLAA